MKLCYQVATPDVAIAESVTAYQGPLDKTFGDIAAYGYDGVELMTIDPGKLNWEQVRRTAQDLGLVVGLVCTGEIFGQLGLSFADPDPARRAEAVARVKEIIDFAASQDAKVNIGRVRGQYRPGVARQQTEEWAVEAFQVISDYAAPKNVMIALENVTIMQTNFVNTMAEAKRIIDMTDRPNFKAMMDVFHMNIEEKDMYQAIRDYSDINVHVHLSDNNRRYPGNCGMDFPKVIQTFHDVGYDDLFCTEIFQDPSMEESAKRSIAYLAPIFEKIYGRKPRV